MSGSWIGPNLSGLTPFLAIWSIYIVLLALESGSNYAHRQ
jgi:hypothetical protein